VVKHLPSMQNKTIKINFKISLGEYFGKDVIWKK
jgi:hypothetical protein